jgi:benzoyl-CoA reductase subunit A
MAIHRYYLGIDLGSTTSKAVIIDENDEIIGRGITNTRANYKVAAEIARLEAIYNARFSLLKKKLGNDINSNPIFSEYISGIENAFQFLQFDRRLKNFNNEVRNTVLNMDDEALKAKSLTQINEIAVELDSAIRQQFSDSRHAAQSKFFRDILGECYNECIKKYGKESFETLMLLFDKSITPVENELIEFDFKDLVHKAMNLLDEKYIGMADNVSGKGNKEFDAEMNLLMGNYQHAASSFRKHIDDIAEADIVISNMVGTGYGRALLPFPEDCIKSEILCHAYGAHAVFPNTRTVLDIGGQDTKSIQVDQYGLVTSFCMNDRCAAGCGRYLGYIADELNISIGELGPLAMQAEKEVNICSTCTVFAGAELRELLNIGEKREDILAGLHRAIVMRALSLLARSGGVRNEFTFTGGVARNQAVLKYVTELVKQNYGEQIVMNVHSDSIFMGSLGAAMFARRNIKTELPAAQKETEALN